MIDKDLLTMLRYPDLEISFTLVYLEDSIETITAMRPYLSSEKKTLNTLLASATLMSTLLSHEGELTLQTKNLPGLSPTVAKYSDDGSIRGLLTQIQPPEEEEESTPKIGSHIGLTYFSPHSRETRHSLITLQNNDISTLVSCYLEHTSAIPTWTFVGSTENRAIGIILRQENPSKSENWGKLTALFDKVEESDWLLYPNRAQQIISKISTHSQTPELLLSTEVNFSCQCSREKMHNAILLMDEKEAKEILDSNAFIEVICHYCQKQRNFSAKEVNELFGPPGKEELH